jgi:hypothetical protein
LRDRRCKKRNQEQHARDQQGDAQAVTYKFYVSVDANMLEVQIFLSFFMGDAHIKPTILLIGDENKKKFHA